MLRDKWTCQSDKTQSYPASFWPRNKNWFKNSIVREIEGGEIEDAKLLRYCFIRRNHAHFRSNRWEMTDLSLAVNKNTK